MTYTPKYLTLEDWIQFRNTTPSDSTSPSELQVLDYIEMAEMDFELEVGNYSIQDDVDVISKGRAHGVTLDYPVTLVNSIYISNGDLYNPTWSTNPLNTTDYALKDNGRIIIRDTVVNREYKVNIDSGYSVEDMPQNIKYLVYLLSMKFAFNSHLFENNISDNTTRIVDVEVYKEITNGGNPFGGFSSLNTMINDAKSNIKGKLRSRLG